MNKAFKKQLFFNHPISIYFCLELFFNLMHPSPFLQNLKFTVFNQELGLRVAYRYNDILVILSHMKILLICAHFLSITKFNSSKMQRIIYLFKYDDTNVMLPIKAFIKSYPVQTMVLTLFFSIFYFSAIIIGRFWFRTGWTC